MIKSSQVVGLDEGYVIERLMQNLLWKSFEHLFSTLRPLHPKLEGKTATLGWNANKHLSYIHQLADSLPYPVMSNHRTLENANLPYGTEITPSLTRQWQRINEFVSTHDRFNNNNRPLMTQILSAIGTLFDKNLSRFHVQESGFPQGDVYTAMTEEMADSFANSRTIPEPYLNIFYSDGSMIPSFPEVINQVYKHAEGHFFLTSDLWPSYITADNKKEILLNSVRYLFFKDILDRSAEFEAHRIGADEVRAIALRR